VLHQVLPLRHRDRQQREPSRVNGTPSYYGGNWDSIGLHEPSRTYSNKQTSRRFLFTTFNPSQFDTYVLHSSFARGHVQSVYTRSSKRNYPSNAFVSLQSFSVFSASTIFLLVQESFSPCLSIKFSLHSMLGIKQCGLSIYLDCICHMLFLGSLGLEGSCSIGNVYTGLQEQM
jgi:hypothetical protein